MQDTKAMMCPQQTAMKESIESTKATIQLIQKDFDTALAKARDDIDAAKLQAETKLNSLASNIENMSKKKKTRSFGFCASFQSTMLWSILIVCMALLSFHALSLNLSVAPAELLFSSLGETYDFPVKAAFFTAAAFYPVVVWHLTGWSRRVVKSTNGKIVLVDVGVQTDEFCGVARGIARRSESVNESKGGSINSDSVASLTNSDDTIDSYDGEVVHYKSYVEPMRREDNTWKKYGKLHMSLSTINGKPCMIFRNDVGVLHMNLPIAKGQKFDTDEDRGYIRFASIEDEVKGIESFMLKIPNKKVFDKVHSKLMELAK